MLVVVVYLSSQTAQFGVDGSIIKPLNQKPKLVKEVSYKKFLSALCIISM